VIGEKKRLNLATLQTVGFPAAYHATARRNVAETNIYIVL
jgi:hypothetical protein